MGNKTSKLEEEVVTIIERRPDNSRIKKKIKVSRDLLPELLNVYSKNMKRQTIGNDLNLKKFGQATGNDTIVPLNMPVYFLDYSYAGQDTNVLRTFIKTGNSEGIPVPENDGNYSYFSSPEDMQLTRYLSNSNKILNCKF